MLKCYKESDLSRLVHVLPPMAAYEVTKVIFTLKQLIQYSNSFMFNSYLLVVIAIFIM